MDAESQVNAAADELEQARNAVKQATEMEGKLKDMGGNGKEAQVRIINAEADKDAALMEQKDTEAYVRNAKKKLTKAMGAASTSIDVIKAEKSNAAANLAAMKQQTAAAEQAS